MKVLCDSRGYHAYRQIWRPKVNQYLRIRPKKKNLYDSYAISISGNLPGKIAVETLMCHFPRDISGFRTFFTKYGRVSSAIVRENKFRRSPITR